jgi:hypothetical protein
VWEGEGRFSRQVSEGGVELLGLDGVNGVACDVLSVDYTSIWRLSQSAIVWQRVRRIRERFRQSVRNTSM